MDNRHFKVARKAVKPGRVAIEATSNVEEVTASGITRAKARTYSDAIKFFVIADEGPGLSGEGAGFWQAEDEVVPKLCTWMVEKAAPHTLWISNPSYAAAIFGLQAEALAVVAAERQAKVPLISHFCRRPRPDEMPRPSEMPQPSEMPRPREMRAGMSHAQVEIIGMLYSLIFQLLQFGAAKDEVEVSTESLVALNGRHESWSAGLKVFRALLDRTPVLMYCVIDGLNDLEFQDGREQCRQFLDILFARQRKRGTVFNILLTTAGQSTLLPWYVHVKDIHVAKKGRKRWQGLGSNYI
ncbi:hypothetical protein F5B18DRAFT_629515 [Nemania serpens]|nr:hypothetical protein F5B18DRAFT_629515 [Nemania serpens]